MPHATRKPSSDESANAPPVAEPAYRRQPRQHRGQERVDRLLDATADIIAESGLHGVTAEAIASRARTAKGSLYQFFPNRDAVVAALALRYANDLRSIRDRAFATDARAMPLQRLIDRIVRPLALFHDQNPAFRRVFMIADAPPDPTGDTPTRVRTQLFDSFVDQLDVLFATRNPALGARERKRAALVSASIGQAILARRDRATISEKRALLQELRQLLLVYLSPLLDEAPDTATLP